MMVPTTADCKKRSAEKRIPFNKPELHIPFAVSEISEENREEVASQLLQAECDCIYLTCTDFFAEEKRAELESDMRKARLFFESKGINVTIWINMLGYSGKRNQDYQKRYADCVQIRNTAGVTSGDVVCLTDKKFRAFLINHVCSMAKTGVKTVLLDDDLTLSGRNACICTCDNHLKLYSERVGRPVTREDIAESFSGPPNELRTACLDVQGETVLDFCRELRESVNQKTGPDVRLGLCATYTGYDLESNCMEEIVRTLAGSNPPLLRLSGAPFWSCRATRLFDSMGLGSVVEFLRFQESFLRGSGIQCSYENDPYPRRRQYVPSSYMECYDKMMLTTGWIIRQKYLMRYTRASEFGENGYWQHHCRNLQDDEIILQIFADKTPVGLRVHYTRDISRRATLPSPFESDKVVLSLCSQPRAGDFAFENSIPTAYEGGQPGIVFWEHARTLPDEVIRRGLILDIKAAQILTERGYDVGLRKVVQLDKAPFSERFIHTPDDLQNLSDRDRQFYAVVPAPGAEVQSYWQMPPGTDLSALAGTGVVRPAKYGLSEIPACYTYTNADGCRFAVYAFDSCYVRYAMPTAMPGNIPFTLQPGRDFQLAQIYKFLSGGTPLPVTCFQHPQLYILASKKDDRMAVLFTNVFPDPVIDPIVNLDGDYSVVNSTDRSIIGECSSNGKLKLQMFIPAYHYCAIELKAK